MGVEGEKEAATAVRFTSKSGAGVPDILMRNLRAAGGLSTNPKEAKGPKHGKEDPDNAPHVRAV